MAGAANPILRPANPSIAGRNKSDHGPRIGQLLYCLRGCRGFEVRDGCCQCRQTFGGGCARGETVAIRSSKIAHLSELLELLQFGRDFPLHFRSPWLMLWFWTFWFTNMKSGLPLAKSSLPVFTTTLPVLPTKWPLLPTTLPVFPTT